MVVLPALSKPKTNILASLSPKMDINRDIQMPILSKCSEPPADGLLSLDLSQPSQAQSIVTMLTIQLHYLL